MKPLIQDSLAKGAVVVDVRSPEEFRRNHCEGSINIPLQTLELRSNELDKNKPLIVCCASGGRSAVALKLLQARGHKNVINAGSWANVKCE